MKPSASLALVCSLSLLTLPAGCAHDAAAGDPVEAFGPVGGQVVPLLVRAAGAEMDDVPPEARGRLEGLARDQACPCPGMRGTLADCLEPGCVQARYMSRAMLRWVGRKDPADKINSRLLERYGPLERETVDLDGAPCRGSGEAPVVMVVFSDFECPFCALASRLLPRLAEQAGDSLRICYKHWPLKYHKHAPLAARAAVAAQLQGKFWEMHDLLFAHRTDLEREDLLGYADELGLDRSRFERDLDSAAARSRVERDKAEAERLRLRGTPTFLINGKRMNDPKSIPDFLDWIEEEQELLREK
jgi:2-hydroxychromene-2-carboxylate isomerase